LERNPQTYHLDENYVPHTSVAKRR